MRRTKYRVNGPGHGQNDSRDRVSARGAGSLRWIAVDGSSAVGFADLEVTGDVAALAFYIRRDLRRRGLGSTLLELLAEAAAGLGVVLLVGEAAPTNEPSVAAMLSSALIEIGVTDEGYVRLERQLR